MCLHPHCLLGCTYGAVKVFLSFSRYIYNIYIIYLFINN